MVGSSFPAVDEKSAPVQQTLNLIIHGCSQNIYHIKWLSEFCPLTISFIFTNLDSRFGLANDVLALPDPRTAGHLPFHLDRFGQLPQFHGKIPMALMMGKSKASVTTSAWHATSAVGGSKKSQMYPNVLYVGCFFPLLNAVSKKLETS